MLPNCVDGSAASEREVSKNIGQESQFGSTVGLFLLQYELLADQLKLSSSLVCGNDSSFLLRSGLYSGM